MKTSIVIQNLKCGGCAATITERLSKLGNITNVVVVHEESKVVFNHEDHHQRELVEQKLKDLGYPPIDDENRLVSKAKSLVSCATGRISKL